MRTDQVDLFAGSDDAPTEAGPGHECTRLCRELLEAQGPDAELEELYDVCKARHPNYVAGLTLTSFHQRHALPAKRDVWGRTPWE